MYVFIFINRDIDLSLIALVTAKLTKAEATYRELNP